MGELGFGGPDGAFDLFFCLGVGVGAVAEVVHVEPAGGFEVEEAVAVVGVEGVAEVFAELKFLNAALLLNFAEGCLADIFALLLHAFGEVPYAVVVDDEVFAFFVTDDASAGGNGGEVCGEPVYGLGFVLC